MSDAKPILHIITSPSRPSSPPPTLTDPLDLNPGVLLSATSANEMRSSLPSSSSITSPGTSRETADDGELTRPKPRFGGKWTRSLSSLKESAGSSPKSSTDSSKPNLSRSPLSSQTTPKLATPSSSIPSPAIPTNRQTSTTPLTSPVLTSPASSSSTKGFRSFFQKFKRSSSAPNTKQIAKTASTSGQGPSSGNVRGASPRGLEGRSISSVIEPVAPVLLVAPVAVPSSAPTDSSGSSGPTETSKLDESTGPVDPCSIPLPASPNLDSPTDDPIARTTSSMSHDGLTDGETISEAGEVVTPVVSLGDDVAKEEILEVSNPLGRQKEQPIVEDQTEPKLPLTQPISPPVSPKKPAQPAQPAQPPIRPAAQRQTSTPVPPASYRSRSPPSAPSARYLQPMQGPQGPQGLGRSGSQRFRQSVYGLKGVLNTGPPPSTRTHIQTKRTSVSPTMYSMGKVFVEAEEIADSDEKRMTEAMFCS